MEKINVNGLEMKKISIETKLANGRLWSCTKDREENRIVLILGLRYGWVTFMDVLKKYGVDMPSIATMKKDAKKEDIKTEETAYFDVYRHTPKTVLNVFFNMYLEDISADKITKLNANIAYAASLDWEHDTAFYRLVRSRDEARQKIETKKKEDKQKARRDAVANRVRNLRVARAAAGGVSTAPDIREIPKTSEGIDAVILLSLEAVEAHYALIRQLTECRSELIKQGREQAKEASSRPAPGIVRPPCIDTQGSMNPIVPRT